MVIKSATAPDKPGAALSNTPPNVTPAQTRVTQHKHVNAPTAAMSASRLNACAWGCRFEERTSKVHRILYKTLLEATRPAAVAVGRRMPAAELEAFSWFEAAIKIFGSV